MENSREPKDQELPRFFQNSCPGNSVVESDKAEELMQTNVRPEEEVHSRETEQDGWTQSLSLLPNFENKKLDSKLISHSATMPKNRPAPKAFRNKKHGYRLWKKGYVSAVFVKPDVKWTYHLK